MGKLYSLISALLLTVSATFAASPDSYEWWFDNDVASAQTGPVSGSTIDLPIDTSDLPKGIHYFNLRLAEGDSIYGSVYRKPFHAIGPDDAAISYEYWYDYDYASKVSGAIAVGSNHLELDVATLPQGSHYFNMRLGYGDGKWGSVYRKMVLHLAGTVDVVAYEYWIDNDYSAKAAGTLSEGANIYEIDLEGLRKGLHRFSYRLQTGTGVWGAPYTKYFYCTSNDARFTEYEYWLDNDYAGRVSGNATSNPVSFEVDLSNFDKSGGAHYFNLRTRDGDGDWSPTYRRLIVFSDNEKRRPIIGYNHFLNGESLGYVEVERQFVDNYMFEVNLPNTVYPSLANRRPTFDGDRVYIAGTDTVEYTMQIKTEFGWAAPQNWDIGISNDFETTAVGMKVNTQQTFAAPTDLQFVAVKFTASGTPLYFRSDAAVALDIYKEGERVGSFTPDQVKGMAMTVLEAGEYFGVLHSMADKEAENFTLHLMDTPNMVPMPRIEYADETVTITCSRDDSLIRYTLDGKDPTEESTLYEKEFTLNHNAVVKAKAWVSGSDILPSEVAEYIIDSYKVATPTGKFDAEARKLTITCATDGAAIFYAFATDGDWTAYSDSIAISKNCTVYAKATLKDYNDSDVAEIPVTALADNVPAPLISFEDGIVTIECANKDAEIHYTVDNTNLTAESPLYTEPFPLDRNATVRAFALVPGLDIEPSDVTTKVIDSYKVSTPTGEFNAETRQLTLKCATAGAKISYTFTPDGDWTPYSDPIAISKNCIVYAKATRDGYHDSEVAEYIIDSYKVATPTGEFDSQTRKLTLLCETEDAKIFYALTDGGAWTVYSTPITIDGNRTVYAKATLDGYNDSDVAEIVVSDVKCSPVSIDYNGRYVTLTSGDSGASIRYSTDGSNPSSGMEYSGTFDVKGVCLLRAVALKAGYMNSDIAELPIDRYADNEHAETAAEGLLSSAFEWDISLPDTISTFRVEGRLNDADYAFLHSMAGLRHLDIRNVAEASIPDRTFSGSRLVSISLPSDLQEYGDSIFSGSSRLSSVLWNSKTLAPEERLMDGLSNPNLLLYVPAETDFTGYNGVTVVKGGHAETVEIHYGYPYYAAEDFRADHVSIAREFRETTEVETCRGWETIVLPFAPTEITHEVNGAAVPFAAWDGDTDGMKPFWLYSSVSDGWEEASSIEACVPYIISMPNNADYVPSFNLAGWITFSADNVDLGPETSVALSTPWKENTEFEGTFMPVEEDGLLSLNVNANGGELLPGSAFVTNDVTVPFGAYVRGASGRKAMPVFGDSNGVDIPTLGDAGLVIETPAPGMLRISSGRERRVAVITTTGVTVRTLSLHPGETVTIEGLTRDLYIVGGVKVMVK